MSEFFSLTVIVGILASAIRLATPYLYASIGEAFAQTSGVVNLGVDGIMLVGGFVGFYVTLTTGNLWLGLLAAMIAGLLMGLLMSLISVTLKAEQGISGIGLYMFGLGLSALLFKELVGTVLTIDGFSPLRIPVLGNIPVVGDIFFNQSLLVYGAFLLVPLAWFVLDKTTLGLKIKSVGQNPAAADSLGVSVDRTLVFLCMSGSCAGRPGGRFALALPGKPVSRKLDSRAGLYRGRLGVLWRLAPTGHPGRSALVQHGQCNTTLDAGPGLQY